MLRSILKNTLRQFGLRLYTDQSLPTGVDALLDISRLGLSAMPTFFDVGANTGQTVDEILAHSPKARIFAFEPFPETFAQLREHAARLPNVQIYPLAMGASPGTLQVAAQGISSDFNSLVHTSTAGSDATPTQGEVAITVDTIDAVCARQGIQTIDVLKTDTEGYDLEVLKGADGMLTTGKVRYVLTEVTFDRKNTQNTPFAPVFEFLASKNFRFLGLYDIYPLHHFAEPLLFCNALFVHRGEYKNA